MKLWQVRPSARTAGLLRLLVWGIGDDLSMLEEEFDSRAGATPRDHRIYRTAKLELEEDVEGVGWYGGR